MQIGLLYYEKPILNIAQNNNILIIDKSVLLKYNIFKGSELVKTKKLWIKWIFCGIPAFLAALMYFLLPHFPKFCEYVFSRGIFRIIGFPFQKIISLLPFSVTELAVILAIPFLITLLAVFVIKIIKKSGKIKIFEKGMRFTAWCLSVALLIYMVMHGANYYRIPVAELLDLPERTYTAEDLYKVTCDIVNKANAVRQKLPEDENGCVVLSVTESELLKNADDCYNNLNKDYPFLKTGVTRAKSVMLSHYWSYTGITGVYCPWLSEANVNTDTPQSSRAHTAAHEIAHTMGIAREDECNFLAWLACTTCGNADYEYSGHLSAYIYCINTLSKTDKELWQKAVSLCSDGMIRDLKQRNAYWKSFEGEVMETSNDFNDSFIKANGVESGVFSYNRMVELLLRYYDIDKI